LLLINAVQSEFLEKTLLITQRRSLVKNVGCFCRNVFVCGFVCQHDNFRTSKHRMMKLGHRTKISAEFKFGGHSPPPGCTTPKMWRFAESRCPM